MRRVKEDRCDYRSMPAVLTELAAEFNSTVRLRASRGGLNLVPNLSQPYPKLIPALSQFCIRPVPVLSQPYPSPIPALSQSCSSPIPTLSQPCADSVPAETSSKSHTNLCLFQLEAINIKRRINLPLSERVHPKCQLVYLKSRVVTVTCSTCRHSVSVPIVPDTVPEMVGLTSYRRPSTRHGSHSNLVGSVSKSVADRGTSLECNSLSRGQGVGTRGRRDGTEGILGPFAGHLLPAGVCHEGKDQLASTVPSRPTCPGNNPLTSDNYNEVFLSKR
uniref:Uncharacterized protein n=1 Tax=Timema monikensis TaxID=170555 RepID=A0A7R9ECU7_9NEOP|nr:unnamed protein product [Timema monikensis]